jgi:hypothetical protein
MDIFFNNKYDKILSLGSNCCIKFFIKNILRPPYGETELFDYIGTSIKQINKLILNDFEDLTTDTCFQSLIIFNNDEPIITNTKYDIRFKHDLKKLEDISNPLFKEKIERRILRFKQNVVNFKNILFIRQQESNHLRVHNIVNMKSEIEELRRFIDILRMKYSCANITIIYINLDLDGWNKEHDIFSVKISSLNYNWRYAPFIIEAIFNKKKVISLL